MLDFSRLRSGPDGWRGSFEDLVRQLGQLNPPASASEFRHIHGAGGDGGVEAYWTLADGGEHGYQAKFHTRPGDIDWGALDGSIRTALSTRPRLVAIQVAIACDLSDVVAGRAGQPGWRRWDTHIERWRALARGAGRDVEFLFWGATDIEAMLARPQAAGLLQYWFGDAALTREWSNRRFEETVAALDERFHPEDHIDVGVRTVFDGLRRNEDWRKRLADANAEVLDQDVSGPGSSTAAQAAFETLANTMQALHGLAPDARLPADRPFPTQAWRDAVDAIRGAAYAASRALPSSSRGGGSDSADYARHRLSRLREAVDQLDDALVSPAKLADDTRFALLSGRAGSGKSHLLAAEVAKALADGEPAVMLLGTDFAGVEQPATLIARRLHLPAHTTQDELLGMLSAAAERAGSRALLVIDALNEGGGARYWRDRLAPFVAAALARPRVALALSCRTEYQDYLLSAATRGGAVEVEVRGFLTAEEQEAAARVYMDRRGIVRPATPLLSPEFTNPLFLRTACLALQQEGRTEFPRGLRGAQELLGFYLATAGRHLGTAFDGSDELVGPLKRAVLALAGHMAANRVDHVPRGVASGLIATAFAGHPEPTPFGWLDLLRQRGVLRLDPGTETGDDWAGAEDVVRFGFQRFQEHLVAQALIRDAPHPAGLFDATGPLAFLLGRYGVAYETRGVFQALAIQFADRWKVELVDQLPGGASRWWDEGEVQDAFLESARWRLTTSFTSRTGELLDEMDDPDAAHSLLLELAVVQQHPWNANLLHRHLSSVPLPERDAQWTTFVNSADRDAASPANRIIDWALGPGAPAAEDETLRLALLALGWLFGSTSGSVRDRATKAAVEILLARPSLHAAHVSAFRDVDDPYVVERVLAAAAGACLRDPSPERLAVAAAAAWEAVFSRPNVPPHTLLRDYARLVVDLAAQRSAPPPGCDLARCRPPYGSTAPDLALDKEQIRADCEAAGAGAIYSSCVGHFGDFGRYVIKSRTDDFTIVPLAGPRPMSRADAYEAFKAEVAAGNELRAMQFGILEQLHRLRRQEARAAKRGIANHPALATMISSLPRLETEILSSLPASVRERYAAEALPHLESRTGWATADGKLPKPDHVSMQLWVARRAVALGWTKELFPYDGSGGDERHRATRVERIGEKYQWIAYHELLARMADNYWLADRWGADQARAYDNPLDLEFTRDIEPTVPAAARPHPSVADAGLPAVPRLPIAAVEPTDMPKWVFDADVPRDRLALASSADVVGDGGWLTLNRYAAARLDYAGDAKSVLNTRFRQEDFHFLMLVAVERRTRAAFVRAAKGANFDFHDWFTHDHVDGPYLYEAGVRATWPDRQWMTSSEFRGPALRFTRFTNGYQWESHLDGSLPEGFSMEVPAPWLLDALRLSADPHRLGVYVDAEGEPAIVSHRGGSNAYCLVRREPMMTLLESRGLVPLWAGVGERTGWPRQGVNEGHRRRWNGLLWTVANGTRRETWCEDHRPDCAETG